MDVPLKESRVYLADRSPRRNSTERIGCRDLECRWASTQECCVYLFGVIYLDLCRDDANKWKLGRTGVQQSTNAPMMTVMVRKAFLALLLFPLLACRLALVALDVLEFLFGGWERSERSSSNCLFASMPTLVRASKLVRFGDTGVCSPLVSFDDERFVASNPLDDRFWWFVVALITELEASSSTLVCRFDADDGLDRPSADFFFFDDVGDGTTAVSGTWFFFDMFMTRLVIVDDETPIRFETFFALACERFSSALATW